MAGLEFTALVNVMQKVERATGRLAEMMERQRNIGEKIDISLNLQQALGRGTTGARTGAVGGALESGLLGSQATRFVRSHMAAYRTLTAKSRSYAHQSAIAQRRHLDLIAQAAALPTGARQARVQALSQQYGQQAAKLGATAGLYKRQALPHLQAAEAGTGRAIGIGMQVLGGARAGAMIGGAAGAATAGLSAAVAAGRALVDIGMQTIHDYGRFSAAGAMALGVGQIREFRRNIMVSHQLGGDMIGFMEEWQDMLDRMAPIGVKLRRSVLRAGQKMLPGLAGAVNAADSIVDAVGAALSGDFAGAGKAIGQAMEKFKAGKEGEQNEPAMKTREFLQGRAAFHRRLFGGGVGMGELRDVLGNKQLRTAGFVSPTELMYAMPQLFGAPGLGQGQADFRARLFGGPGLRFGGVAGNWMANQGLAMRMGMAGMGGFPGGGGMDFGGMAGGFGGVPGGVVAGGAGAAVGGGMGGGRPLGAVMAQRNPQFGWFGLNPRKPADQRLVMARKLRANMNVPPGLSDKQLEELNRIDRDILAAEQRQTEISNMRRGIMGRGGIPADVRQQKLDEAEVLRGNIEKERLDLMKERQKKLEDFANGVAMINGQLGGRSNRPDFMGIGSVADSSFNKQFA